MSTAVSYVESEEEPDDATQQRVVTLMLMRWRGEREVSPWERAVYFALRTPEDAAPPLSDADLAFLDFVADRAVASVRSRRAG